MKKMYDDERIKEIAAEAGGTKKYLHQVKFYRVDNPNGNMIYINVISNNNKRITNITTLREVAGSGYLYFPATGYWAFNGILNVVEIQFNNSNALSFYGIKTDATITSATLSDDNFLKDIITEL